MIQRFIILVLSIAFTEIYSQNNKKFESESESILLHVDNAYKISGDIVWFKLYLRNTPFAPEQLSSIAYVELVSSDNAILTRLKLKCSQGFAYGQILLPKQLPTGTYTIRAFTLWMNHFNRENSTDQRLQIRNLKDLTGTLDQFNNTSSKRDSLSRNQVSIVTSKDVFKPRETITVKLLATNKKNLSLAALSMSVRYLENSSTNYSYPFAMDNHSIPHDFKKEKFIYPQHPNTLHEIDFDTTFQSVANLRTTDSSYSETNLETLATRKLAEHYPTLASLGEFTFPQLPSDISYPIDDYESLPNLEEFIKELIPNARLKKSGNKKGLRIRNTENKEHIYFYKKDPLLVVNGSIVRDIDAVLNLPVDNIQSINLCWSSELINQAQIFGLADNGIFSINTKRPISLNEELTEKIYKGFHITAKYKSQVYVEDESGDELPDFRDQLYWNPEIILTYKSLDFSFSASDKLGDYSIEIVGLSDQGEIIIEQKHITVSGQIK